MRQRCFDMSEFDDLLNKYFGYVDQVISYIPYERVKTWKEFFLNPSKTATTKKESIGTRLLDLYVKNLLSLVLGILVMVPAIAGAAFAGGVTSLMLPTFGLPIALFIALVIGVIYLILPILGLIYSLMEYIVAKILGGKADFTTHFNASSLAGLSLFVILLPLTIALIPLGWLESIPYLGFCVMIAVLPLVWAVRILTTVVSIYGYFLRYQAFKTIHGFSTARAVLTVVIPMLIVFGIIILLVILFYVAMIALIFGIMTMAGNVYS